MKKLFLMLICSTVLTACFFDSSEIKLVKNGTLNACPNQTIKQIVDGFFGSPKWESGQSDQGVKFVNIRGEMTYMNKPVEGMVQFKINNDGNTFNYQAFEMNGIPQNNLVAMQLLSKMCESGR